jgi:8-oxo-dGTP diphosphatase
VQNYVVGFAFNRERNHVLLVKKEQPEWQKGRLNGVGGKVEKGETPAQAMSREFLEEAGIPDVRWKEFCTLRGPDWNVYFFRAYIDLNLLCRKENDVGEQLYVATASGMGELDTIYNLRWLVPLAVEPSGVYVTAEEERV